MLTIYPSVEWRGHKRINTGWKITGRIDNEQDIETLTRILKTGLKQGKEYISVTEVKSEDKEA